MILFQINKFIFSKGNLGRREIEDNQIIHEEKFYLGKRMRAITISHDLNLWAIEDGGAGRLLKLTLE